MSKIFVFDKLENKYIKVQCVDKEYSKDLNLFTHKLAIKMARDRFNSVDVVARAKALEKISIIVKEEEKKLKTIQRKIKARVKGIGTDKELNSVHQVVPCDDSELEVFDVDWEWSHITEENKAEGKTENSKKIIKKHKRRLTL